MAETRTIRVGALARVEGEGALHVEIADGQVQSVRLDIYEPPRFFEAFLRGRDIREVPDITARICGICPVAYQMGSCHALEKAVGIFDQIDPPIRTLRTLMYCGEWIESHVLHMFLLHLPDFLGFESAISMARDHAPLIRRALRIKRLGNDLISLLGGRSVHPVGACVGGFYSAPDRESARRLLPETQACLEEMCELSLALAGMVKIPELERPYEFLALRSADEYPMNLGRIVTSGGLEVDQEKFLELIEEHQAPHSTALHARIRGGGDYLVGPLARLNLNADRLHPRARQLLDELTRLFNRPLPWTNSFYSLPARAVETVHALARAADILKEYEPPARSLVPFTPHAGEGGHGTEAPRGLCWHHYRTNPDGTIAHARIIPPTSQNQGTIESDLRVLASQVVHLSDEDAALRCEHLIRNYDPCISCSVHFLRFIRHER